MATFNTKQTLYASPSLIPDIAERIKEDFLRDGFEVSTDALSSGGYDISITKGGTFKAVLGMKTALKVTLLPLGGNINFEAGVGIWGQQAIPTIISMFFFWPVLLTQMWGMIEQSQLDDKALSIAQSVIKEHVHGNPSGPDANHGYSSINSPAANGGNSGVLDANHDSNLDATGNHGSATHGSPNNNGNSTHGDSDSAANKFCTHCGTKNPASAHFCCGCGREME